MEVYSLGLILMTPQLFLNYKNKSVAFLPWRRFMSARARRSVKWRGAWVNILVKRVARHGELDLRRESP